MVRQSRRPRADFPVPILSPESARPLVFHRRAAQALKWTVAGANGSRQMTDAEAIQIMRQHIEGQACD